MYSFRRCFFSGFPARARVTDVGAFPISVEFSLSTGVTCVTTGPTFLAFLLFFDVPGVVGFPAVVVFPAVAGVLAR